MKKMSFLFPKCPQVFTSHETIVSNFFQPRQNTGLTKFGAHWLIVVDAICKQSQMQQFFSNSRANNPSRSNLIRPIINLIQDLMVIYIFAKFTADWLKL